MKDIKNTFYTHQTFVFLFIYFILFSIFYFFIDICILNVIWQLNALNGFSFHGY